MNGDPMPHTCCCKDCPCHSPFAAVELRPPEMAACGLCGRFVGDCPVAYGENSQWQACRKCWDQRGGEE